VGDDRERERRDQVAGQPGVEAGAGLRGDGPIYNHRENVVVAEDLGGGAKLVVIGVLVGDVGDAVGPRQAGEELERADALAGRERVRQLLIEDGDVQARHGGPVAGWFGG
jgi:hypothetical protein